MATPTAQHLPFLDGWRGVAIALLLVGHFFPLPGLNLGTVGVKLFFVLSGYLMARILFINKTPIPLFLRRRASRILPPAAAFLLLVVVWHLVEGRPVRWAEVAAAATFLNNYVVGATGDTVMPFGHFWSLCVEEHSYFLLSFVAVAARAEKIRAKAAVLAVVLLSALAGIVYFFAKKHNLISGPVWPHTEVASFPLFLSVFLLLRWHKTPPPNVTAWVVPVLLVSGVILHWWSIPAPVQTIVGGAAFALAVNLVVGTPQAMHRVLSLYPLRQLGTWSFSIYLWQQPFFQLVQQQEMSRLSGVASALAAGIVAYYAVEKPARTYLNRVWVVDRPRSPAHESAVPSPAPEDEKVAAAG